MSETMSTATEVRSALLIKGLQDVVPEPHQRSKGAANGNETAGTLTKAGMSGNEKVLGQLGVLANLQAAFKAVA